jgi:hypothetical protein
VIIVPSVVDAISMQDRERLNSALKRYADFSGNLGEGPRFVPDASAKKPAASPKVKP